MLQVSPYDCTGCNLCVHACPDHALTSTPISQVLAPESTNWDFFKTLPNRWVGGTGRVTSKEVTF